MAKGYPDFFGFSMFPYHGTSFIDSALHVVSPGDIDTLVSLDFKGIVTGGHLHIQVVASDQLYQVNLTVDGSLICEVEGLNEQWVDNALLTGAPMRTILRSYQLKTANIELAGAVSFQSEYKLSLWNNDPTRDVTCNSRLYYHHIQT